MKPDVEKQFIEAGSAIALIGNIRVGKTALFSQMVGNRTTSIHVPGHPSVSINSGRIKGGGDLHAFDTPGIFSIFSRNEDDNITRDIFLPGMTPEKIQGIIMVLDAKNLKRSIAIALQYAEYGLPMLLDINMIDEAVSRGIEINLEMLSEIFGTEAVTTIARDGIGVRKLISGIKKINPVHHLVKYPDWIEQFIEIVSKLLSSEEFSARAVALLLLADDRGVRKYIDTRYGLGMLEQLNTLSEQYQREHLQECSILLTTLYNKKADQIVSEVQHLDLHPPKSPFLEKFGDWCTRPSTGIPIAILILILMYLFIGSFGATFLVDMINGKVFEGFLIPWMEKLLDPIPNAFIRDMIIDPDFGILPTGVFLALGLVLPVLFCFYIAFGLIEDLGYLPRLSLLLDKILQKMGLNGKGVIPLVMGFSCVTMAILTTRMLDTKKERIIATFILLLGVPCAPLLAVMLIILGKMPVTASLTVFGFIFLQIIVAGFVLNKIIPGKRTSLLMEIPAMRLPKISNIIKMSAKKTFFFMKEAVPVFILASFFVFLFARAGGLAVLERIMEPVISGFMGLPEKSVQVFIKTIIRRESGATELEHLSTLYDNVQLVVNLLVMTFLSPCINSLVVLFKERGSRIALLIMASVWVYAVLMGSIVSHTCRFFGVTFT